LAQGRPAAGRLAAAPAAAMGAEPSSACQCRGPCQLEAAGPQRRPTATLVARDGSWDGAKADPAAWELEEWVEPPSVEGLTDGLIIPPASLQPMFTHVSIRDAEEEDKLGKPLSPQPSILAPRIPSCPDQHTCLARKASGAGPRPAGGDPTFLNLLVSNLEKLEELVYRETFSTFDMDDSGLVPLSDGDLHCFVLANSAIGVDGLDGALLCHAATTPASAWGLDLPGFLRLLREHALPADTAVQYFNDATRPGGGAPAITDCGGNLRRFAAQHMGGVALAEFSQGEQDMIFEATLQGGAARLTLDEWVSCCKRIARIIRVARCSFGKRDSGLRRQWNL